MKLIVFEGTDGTGKSTHARYLSEYLNNKGYKVSLVKAPVKIDEDEVRDMTSRERYEEYLNDMWRVQTKIQQLRMEGMNIVIMDRYTWSLVVYQGGFYVPTHDIFNDLDNMEYCKPDLTFLFTAKSHDIWQRLSDKGTTSFYEVDIEKVMEHQKRYKFLWNNYYWGRSYNIKTSENDILTTIDMVIDHTMNFLSENS